MESSDLDLLLDLIDIDIRTDSIRAKIGETGTTVRNISKCRYIEMPDRSAPCPGM
jgi:hypothetical protein